jgi:hypothetical protein
LRAVAATSLADFQSDEEFAVLVTRRSADGHHQVVATLSDEPLLERVLRNAA